jgi:uncharacterized protein
MAHISALYIYPVKSLGGIALPRAQLTDRGFRFDRRWMIVDEHDEFVTQRDMPAMATIWVEVDDESLRLATANANEIVLPHGAGSGPLRSVRVWNSVVDANPVSSLADQWLSDVMGAKLRLVHMPDASERWCNPERAPHARVSFADGYPFLVTNSASLADLNARIAARHARPMVGLPMNRFRPNLVVDGWAAWQEDELTAVRFGDHTFRFVKPCGRCEVTTTDQATGELSGPEPLATLATFRDSNEFGVMFGQNSVGPSDGWIQIGDVVAV